MNDASIQLTKHSETPPMSVHAVEKNSIGIQGSLQNAMNDAQTVNQQSIGIQDSRHFPSVP